MPNEVPVDFHSSSNYNYHFLIKELANEFAEKFDLVKYQKYKIFSVPTAKEVTEIKVL